MKNRFSNLFGILLLAFVAAATASGQSRSSNSFAGTWDVVVTPRNCATGDPITSFRAAYIFSPDGIFSGVSSGTGSGGRGREQLGVWRHVGDNQYRLRIKAFLFNSAGVSTSYQIVTHDAKLDDDANSWSSVGDSRTFTFDGVQTAVGCSSIVAERVEIE